MVGEQPSWAAYTGQTFDQYQGRGWLDAVHPDDRAPNVEVWAHAVSTGTPCELEHRLRRYDGSYRYFSVRAVPVFTAEGTIREWAGIHTDITERKLTEQTLRDGERRFRELADSMPQIVWAAGPGGHFDYYNRRWYEFTGRPEGIGGDESWADVATSPSPPLPAAPVPAMVSITPRGSMILTAWLPVSVKKTVPSPRTAIPLGVSRRALVAAPRSPM